MSTAVDTEVVVVVLVVVVVDDDSVIIVALVAFDVASPSFTGPAETTRLNNGGGGDDAVLYPRGSCMKNPSRLSGQRMLSCGHVVHSGNERPPTPSSGPGHGRHDAPGGP